MTNESLHSKNITNVREVLEKQRRRTGGFAEKEQRRNWRIQGKPEKFPYSQTFAPVLASYIDLISNEPSPKEDSPPLLNDPIHEVIKHLYENNGNLKVNILDLGATPASFLATLEDEPELQEMLGKLVAVNLVQPNTEHTQKEDDSNCRLVVGDYSSREVQKKLLSIHCAKDEEKFQLIISRPMGALIYPTGYFNNGDINILFEHFLRKTLKHLSANGIIICQLPDNLISIAGSQGVENYLNETYGLGIVQGAPNRIGLKPTLIHRIQ